MKEPVAHKMVGGGHIAGMSKEDRKPSRRHVKRMSIERSANGGHVVTHSFHQPGTGPYVEDEQHTFGKGEHEKVIEHVKKHMGMNRMKSADDAEEAGEVASGAVDSPDEEKDE